jgi:hypothetical protein
MRAPTEPDRVRSIVSAIADVAHIAESRRAEFYQLVISEPQINVVADASRWAKDQRRRAGEAFRKQNGTLAKAARSMRAVKDALFLLDAQERARVDLALRDLGLADGGVIADEYVIEPFAKDSLQCEQIAHSLASALDWAIGIYPFRDVGVHKTLKGTKGGRPKGTKGNPHFHKVVARVLKAASECGGRLPFDKKAGQNSPLVRAIYLLRPLLPVGFLPNVPPLATIERIVRDSRKNSGRRGGF